MASLASGDRPVDRIRGLLQDQHRTSAFGVLEAARALARDVQRRDEALGHEATTIHSGDIPEPAIAPRRTAA